MKFTRLSSTLALGVGLLACALNASAVTINATIGNFEYRLVDLDPTDGITPTISFGWAFSETHVDVCRCGGGEGESVNFSFQYPSSITSSIKMYDVLGLSSISPTEYAAQLGSINISDSIARSTTTATFTLSANTKLIIVGTFNGSVTDYHGETGSLGISSSVDVSIPGASKASRSYSYYNTLLPAGTQYSKSFEIEYSNISTANTTGRLEVGSSAGLTISAVPEPSNYAMLMIGLVVVAGTSARYRRS